MKVFSHAKAEKKIIHNITADDSQYSFMAQILITSEEILKKKLV
jgi:hypothetical protein